MGVGSLPNELWSQILQYVLYDSKDGKDLAFTSKQLSTMRKRIPLVGFALQLLRLDSHKGFNPDIMNMSLFCSINMIIFIK